MEQIKKVKRYPIVLTTVFLGLLFPIIALFLISYDSGVPISLELVKVALQNKVFLIVLLAPFILPLLSYLFITYFSKRVNTIIDERNDQINLVQKVANFADAIGKGNFDNKLDISNTDNELIASLLQMRDNIKLTTEQEEERKLIVNGMAEVGDLLRSHSNLKELGDALTIYLSRKTNCIQCAFYLVKEAEHGGKDDVELISSYAYSRKKYLKGQFKSGEGLVGQAVIEQDQMYRTEIPANYVTITSGLLGDKRPQAILITPLVTNEKAYGAIEMASLNPISKLQRDFLNQLSDIIARTIFNVTVNERTLRLLSESQQMSGELSEQRTQLLLNAEEMEKGRIELEKANAELEMQITEVNNAQKRQNALLERSSEIITIIDQNRIIKYQSPSVKLILGYDAEENVGKLHSVHILESDIVAFEKAFQEIVEDSKASPIVQFRYLKSTGEKVWIESTFTNLLHDVSVKGIVMNSRDITIRRLAEQEQRLRGQMQSLSENSHDLIVRLGMDKKVYYTNPIIQKMTGLEGKHIVNKSFAEASLPSYLTEAFEHVIEEVNASQTTISREESFTTLEGEKIYTFNAIPERGANDEIATILVVAHDVTIQKKIEGEIIHKNKSITESINYSYRIQNSLMPTQQTLTALFAKSFIFYRSKDIVSGDFPYIYQKGNAVFVAAVDCTGHGVPGALMSLIGYFTLNQIMSEAADYNPAQVLDLLHERVQKTLKQDTGDSQAKDGMDIALCKINLKDEIIEFAGAHRPLYHLTNGELNEIKADRYPIAGMHYKNRKPFVNNVLPLKKNDALYFNTDGLPDQFGGADGKQKFMSKRVREIIQENAQTDIQKVGELFVNEFDSWKGNYKQMDDVLLIGIKF